jgi:hypothetical protein
MGEIRNAYKILVEISGGMRPLGRPRHRWDDNNNISMDLGEIGWEVVDSIHLAQDRDQRLALVNTIVNFSVL